MQSFWKKYKPVILDALARALRTMAQTAVGSITGSALLSDVNWPVVASSAALAGLTSLLMSVDRITATVKLDNPSA